MAITYPLNIPSHQFQALDMRLRRASAISASSFTMQQQVYLYDGAAWEAEITLPPLTYAQARQWEAFILSLKGKYGTFLMGNPLHTGSSGTATNVVLDGQALVRATEIDVTGASEGQTLKAGDYFQIGTGLDSHLHQVLQDVTFDASGDATIDIEPPLRSTHASGTALDFTLPKGIWRLSANDVGWSVDQASIHGIIIPCVEAL